MRYLIGLVFPLLVQLAAFAVVFTMSARSGSFVGLLGIPGSGVSLLVLLIVGITGAVGSRPLAGLVFTMLAIAVIPPGLLLIMETLVT